jgi:hypothetical protein
MTKIVVGWILGLVSKPIADWIHTLWRGPRLDLNVESDPHQFQLTASDNGLDQHSYREVYINLEVTNDKPRTAENCRAWLVNIEKRTGDKFESTGFRDSFPLIWAYDPKAESVPIAKGVVRRANIVTIRDDKAGFTPRLRGDNGEVLHPAQYQSVFEENGTYRFTVLVSAQDTPTRCSKICVERNDGQWPPNVWSCK